MKKTLIFLACFAFVAHLPACSWMKSKDKTETADNAESTESIDNELEKVDDSELSLAGNGDEALPENTLGDQAAATTTEQPSIEAAPTEATPAEATPAPEVKAETQANNQENATPPASPDSSFAGVDPGDTATAQSTPPPATETPIEAPADPTISATTPTEAAPAPVAAATTESKPKASLKKVELVPFERNGQLLNTVYIARPKDTYRSIATLIYGDKKKAKDLQKANPSIGSVKPGDKIYYNSPQRPQDNSRVITYYEDQGIAPEIYVTKEGDDIKKVSKELLGYSNAWKEVWVTNSVESKSSLPAGTELRYWKSTPTAAPSTNTEVAKTETLPTPAPEPVAPPPPPAPAPAQAAMNPPPVEPPPMPEAPPTPPPQAVQPPAPPTPPTAQADIPPPPPPVDMAPPVKKAPKKVVHEEPPMGMDSDLMMSLGGAAIAAAGLAAYIVIRKRRQQKEMASTFNDTQVGT